MSLSIGESGFKEQPVKRVLTGDSVSYVVPFEGETYLVDDFLIGLVGADLGAPYTGIPVEKIETEEIGGNQSRVTLYLSAHGDVSYNFDAIGNPIYEIEWQELTKPLETHLHCGKLKTTRPADSDGKKKTWDDWSALTAADYDATGSGVWSLAQYQSLKEAGIDSYNIAFPVVRRTLYFYRNPSGAGASCFEPETPPGEAGAPNSSGGFSLNYLKGTEKLIKDGRLRTLTTEWIGAWVIPSLIYP